MMPVFDKAIFILRVVHRPLFRSCVSVSLVLALMAGTVPCSHAVEYYPPAVAVLEIQRHSAISDLEAASVRKAFLKEFQLSTKFSVLPQKDVFSILNAPSELVGSEQQKLETAQARYQEFDEHYQQGRSAYLRSNFKPAIASFTKALQAVKDAVIVMNDNRRWLNTLIDMAVCYQFLSDDRSAGLYFQMALKLDPTYRLDKTQYPPDIVRQYEGLRKEFLKRPRNSLSVKIDPPGTSVAINGKAYKKPIGNRLSVSVPQGPYIVVVKKEGFSTERLEVVVDKKVVRRSVGLKSLDEPAVNFSYLLKPFPNQKDVDRVRLKRLGQFAVSQSLDVILLNYVTKNKDGANQVIAQLYDRRNGLLSPVLVDVRSSRLMEELARKMVREFERYLDPDGYLSLLKADEKDVAFRESLAMGPAEKPFYSKWWFWTLVGASVIGGGVATYFLVFRDTNEVRIVVSASTPTP